MLMLLIICLYVYMLCENQKAEKLCFSEGIC